MNRPKKRLRVTRFNSTQTKETIKLNESEIYIWSIRPVRKKFVEILHVSVKCYCTAYQTLYVAVMKPWNTSVKINWQKEPNEVKYKL